MIKELRSKIPMQIRSVSRGDEYLEAVVDKKDVEALNQILLKHMGKEAKSPGKKTVLTSDIQKLVKELGGLRNEQTFFYMKNGDRIMYAALWPWQSDPDKVTLKAGLSAVI